jgi:hypothetical protein
MQVYTITPYIPLRPDSRIFPNEHEKNGHFILVAEFFIAVGEGCCTSSGDMRMGDCTKFVFFAQNSGRAMSNVCRSSAIGKLHRLYEGATGDEPTPRGTSTPSLQLACLIFMCCRVIDGLHAQLHHCALKICFPQQCLL